MQPNVINIDDGVKTHGLIIQTTGLAQGDCLSPLLFLVLVSELPAAIQDGHRFVEAVMYADDLALISHSEFHLQQSIATLVNHSRDRGLAINVSKTMSMKISRSGRQGRSSKFRISGDYIPTVRQFCYLGVIIPANGRSYGNHVRERVSQAFKALQDLRFPAKLSLSTALKLFQIKIHPIATYGLKLIWKFLKLRDLECLERVKAGYLKRVLCLHSSARNRLVYTLAEEGPLIEKL